MKLRKKIETLLQLPKSVITLDKRLDRVEKRVRATSRYHQNIRKIIRDDFTDIEKRVSTIITHDKADTIKQVQTMLDQHKLWIDSMYPKGRDK